MTEPRATLDVSHLPDHAWDSRAPLWWGNLLMILIETTTVVLMLTCYYYCARNYDTFPPRAEQPSIVAPFPDRTAATFNTILLVLSCVPMYLTDMAARAKRRWAVVLGLAVMLLICGASTWLRFYEFPAIKFGWSDNAYASIIWTTLVIHLIYIWGGAGEFLIMLLWLLRHDIDEKHALDVTLAGGYWYWLAGMWLPIYVTIYFAPSFL